MTKWTKNCELLCNRRKTESRWKIFLLYIERCILSTFCQVTCALALSNLLQVRKNPQTEPGFQINLQNPRKCLEEKYYSKEEGLEWEKKKSGKPSRYTETFALVSQNLFPLNVFARVDTRREKVTKGSDECAGKSSDIESSTKRPINRLLER